MKRKLKRLQIPRRGIQYIIDPQTRKELQPFAFFDAGIMQRDDEGLLIGMHPHSGIGIITYFEGGNLLHDDSGKNDLIIQDGGAQWIRAGGGVWHKEHYLRKEETQDSWSLTLHQLWMQLPPEWEESEVEYQNVQPEDLPVLENVKLVVGEYQGQSSPLKTPFNMTYLDISLKKDEDFVIQTPNGQTTGFIFPRLGSLSLWEENLPLGRLSILENNEGEISIKAHSDTAFILAMVEPTNYPIVTNGGSIHTNQESMKRSFERIQKINKTENYV